MALIDDWRRRIPASLHAFAGLIAEPADVQLGLLAAAALWPLRDDPNDDAALLDALQALAGPAAAGLLALLRSWPDDRRAAAVPGAGGRAAQAGGPAGVAAIQRCCDSIWNVVRFLLGR